MFDRTAPRRQPKKLTRSTDTYDTIDWLLKNIPAHNGRVGLWGISYPGFYAAAGAIDAHPALKAYRLRHRCPTGSPPTTGIITAHFCSPHAFGWFSGAGWPFSKPSNSAPGKPVLRDLEDGYEFFLRLGPYAECERKVPQKRDSVLGLR
jgi:hypothetical protein